MWVACERGVGQGLNVGVQSKKAGSYFVVAGSSSPVAICLMNEFYHESAFSGRRVAMTLTSDGSQSVDGSKYKYMLTWKGPSGDPTRGMRPLT